VKLPGAAWLTIAGAWITVLLVVLGFSVFFVQRPKPDQFALPLMFWTFYGGLLVVAVGCAIGLPMPQAAFWRTLVMALPICADSFTQGHIYQFIHPFSRDMAERLWLHDVWTGSIVFSLSQIAFALTFATATAIWARRSAPSGDGRRFRLLDMFLLIALVAITLAALRYRSPAFSGIVIQGSAVALLVAAVVAGAGRSHSVLAYTFLAGWVSWRALIAHRFLEEWEQLLQIQWLGPSDDPFGQTVAEQLLQALLPLYAGVATAIMTSLIPRRPPADQR
jgi:hypothetical protein